MTLLGLIASILCVGFIWLATTALVYAPRYGPGGSLLKLEDLKPIDFVKAAGWIILVSAVLGCVVLAGIEINKVRVF